MFFSLFARHVYVYHNHRFRSRVFLPIWLIRNQVNVVYFSRTPFRLLEIHDLNVTYHVGNQLVTVSFIKLVKGELKLTATWSGDDNVW